MSYKKAQVFTLATAFNIVRSAVKKVSDSHTDKTDTIVFNSLNLAIEKKKAEHKGVR